MVPMLRDSVPMEPERITPGSATDPCSARPTRLNCCWRIVDLCAHEKAVSIAAEAAKNKKEIKIAVIKLVIIILING